MGSSVEGRHLVLATLFVAAIVGSWPLAAQELLVNRTFDTDVSGWQTAAPPPGDIEWSPVTGQPPGSLRIFGEDQAATIVDCLSAPGTLDLTADAFMETSGEIYDCSISFRLFSTPDCSGAPMAAPAPPGSAVVVTPNQWEALSFSLDPAPAVASYRPILAKAGDVGGDDACLFDNVSLIVTAPSPAPIPALGRLGLAGLAVLLALVGLSALRR